MLFSVVVPVYNVEKYLDECVKSILAQSCPDFELILVDDGSTDNCPAICDGYAQTDERVRVIHKQNGGLVSARKAGVEIVRGEYVCNVDGDDFLEKDYLKEFESAIRSHNSDIVLCGHIQVYNDARVNVLPHIAAGYYSRADMEQKIFPTLLESADMVTFSESIWAKAFRVELISKVQAAVDSRIKLGEDGACSIPCLFLADSVYVVDKCLYCYRQQSLSMTHVSKPRDFDGPKLVRESFDKWIDFSFGDLATQRDRYVVHSLFNICVSQFSRDEKRSAIKHDIKTQLRDGFYAGAINRARFSAFKGKLMRFTLKHKCMFLLNMFHKRLENKKRRSVQ